ncbi:hypothetical protein GEMRC1_001692 [Eukaryota sp. GEM-RC1]
MSEFESYIRSGRRMSELRDAIESGKLEKDKRSDMLNRTLLHLAAKEGRVAIIELLIEHGNDVEATDDEGATPLHLAALFDQLNSVKVLLSNGANPSSTDKHGDEPIHYAAIGNAVRSARYLIEEAKVDPNRPTSGVTKVTPLHFAAQTDSVQVGHLLICKGANVNGNEDCTESPLHVATRRGKLAFVMLLLGAGADPNIRDSYQKTPLMESARNGHDYVCKVLIAAGTRTEARDQLRRTALRHARMGEHKTTEGLISTAILHVEEWAKELNALIKLRDVRMRLTNEFPPLSSNIEEELDVLKKLVEDMKAKGQITIPKTKELKPVVTKVKETMYREISPQSAAGLGLREHSFFESEYED